jgi:hypothetical protein
MKSVIAATALAFLAAVATPAFASTDAKAPAKPEAKADAKAEPKPAEKPAPAPAAGDKKPAPKKEKKGGC